MAMTVGELNVEIGAKLNKLDRALNEMDRKLAHSKKSADNLNAGFKNLTTSVKGFAAAAGLAFGAREIFNFTKESIRLAGQMEGVRQAYERFADPTLMNRLKEATRGTVTELQLMQAVTTSANFGIDLEQLPTLLEFARRRAKDMGVEVDVLTEKIVRGIGRKSVLILDDLGISASQIKEELGGVAVESASVADITKAIGNIAGKAYAGFAEGAKTSAEQTATLNAELKNTMANIGQGLTPAYNVLLKLTNYYLQSFTSLNSEIQQFNVSLDVMLTGGQKSNEVLKLWQKSTGETTSAFTRLKLLLFGFSDEAIKIAEEQRKLEKTQRDWTAEVQKYTNVLEQGAIPATFNFQKSMEDLYGKIPEETKEVEKTVRDFTDATLEQLEAMRDMGKMANLTEEELDNLGKRLDELSGKILTRASLRNINGLFDEGPNQRETTDGIDRDVGIEYEDEMASAIASANAFLEANEGLLEKLQQNRDAVFQLASSISGTLGNAFASAMVNMKNFGQIMLDTLKGILQQLIAVVAQAAILAVIMNIINPGSATFKGAFKTILGFPGGLEGRASGGPVNFGQAYLVGERGPELFMPGRSGSIMPNNKLGMMGATVAVGGRLLGQDILISNARSQQGLSRQTGR